MTSQTTTMPSGNEEVFRKIPQPHAPAFPVLSVSEFALRPQKSVPSQFDNPNIRHFTAARYALYAALKDMDIRAGEEILIPAYHCSAMITPVLSLGAKPVFYRIKTDLSADLEDMQSLIGSRSRAVLHVNYFGFFQNLMQTRALCDKHGLVLIEDCAHSLYGRHAGGPAGAIGDYAIGSTKKFLACRSGGILTSRAALKQTLPQQPCGLKQNARFFYNSVENALQYGRLGGGKLLVDCLQRLRGKADAGPTADPAVPVAKRTNADPDNGFSEKQAGLSPPLLSRWLASATSRRRLMRKRREYFLYYLDRLQGVRGLTPVFRNLPDGTIPYLFPVLVDDLQEIFPHIEDAGLPLQRFGQFLWDDPRVTSCKKSRHFASHMLQLPCHQGLAISEINWIIATLTTILREYKKRQVRNKDGLVIPSD